MDEITTSSDLTETVETTEEATEDSSVQVESEETTEEQQTDSNQEGQSEDSFFDPNSIPEELKPAYKQMQAAFTKKTQEIAEMRKEFEATKQKAESYGKYEQYIPILEEMLSPQNQANQVSPEMEILEKDLRAQGYGDDAIELMKKTSQFLLEQFNRKEQQAQQQIAQKQEQERFESQLQEAEKIDPRLNDKSLKYTTEEGESFTFADMVASVVQTYPDWKKNVVDATRKAIKRVDSMMGVAKTQGKEELSTLAKSKAKQFPNAKSSPASASNTDGALTIQQAAELAMSQLGNK